MCRLCHRQDDMYRGEKAGREKKKKKKLGTAANSAQDLPFLRYIVLSAFPTLEDCRS